MSGTYNGALWNNVLWFHFGGSNAVLQADLQAFTAFIGNAWAVNVIAKMNQFAAMNHCHSSFYGPDTDLLEADASLSLGGSSAFPAGAAQVAAGISWRTSFGWKGGHPRSYVVGVDTNMLQDSRTLKSTFVSSLAAGAATFRTNANGYTQGTIADVLFGCMSFVRNKAWRDPPVLIPIVSAYVDARPDTQRRRLGPDVP